MSTAVESTQPCAVEAKLWRECLKEFDYSPDRPKGACEGQRVQFYSCIKGWRTRTAAPADASKAGTSASSTPRAHYRDFQLAEECAFDGEQLHNCMMVNAFEVSKCQPQMTLLKRCSAKHDTEARRYLSDDPAIAEFEIQVDNATGLRRIWYKAIGKL